ncbi:MAG: MoaD/ThiS family protein [Bacillota bacterium]
MMVVRILVHGHVAEFFPGGQHEHRLSLSEPMSVTRVIESLGVNPKLIMKVFLNGKPASKEDLVHDSDELLLIAPASGG